MEKKISITLPLVPLRGLTVFPEMVVSFPAARETTKAVLEQAADNKEYIFLVAQRDAKVEEPVWSDLYHIGTIAEVKQILHLPGNMTHAIVEGKKRGRLLQLWEGDDGYLGDIIEIEQDFEHDEMDMEEIALMRVAGECFEAYAKLLAQPPSAEIIKTILSSKRPGEMADRMLAQMTLRQEQKQALHELLHPLERLSHMVRLMNHETQLAQLQKEIETKVRQRLDQTQREYFLREEIRLIQEELGEKDGAAQDAEQFKKLLAEKNPPEEVRTVIEKEIGRFLRIPLTSPESNVVRNYIETVLSLPWEERTKDTFDIEKARKVLDAGHYGLQQVKDRVLEYLAVRANTPKQTAPILCLVGPPGVGKTSIAHSIADALKKKHVRLSLGGIRDEAEIRGHRRTYIGAMPGRIINAMKQAKVVNPLMILDEVDKLGISHNGDPSAALLEVLDAEQNHSFRDHYIELSYDLSEVLFVCTANTPESIPRPLRDRMELLTLSSYTLVEKKHIAKKHLLPKQLKKHGLTARNLKLAEEVWDTLIDGYTKEAGVRQLERTLGQICRKAVVSFSETGKKTITVTEKNLHTFLGSLKYRYAPIAAEPQTGIVRGLAWTQFGGDTLSIEVNTMKGSGRLELTGNMGNVMKESARAAMSYIRSQGDILSVPQEFYKDTDIHIHIPEGAVPKDGPSAGITMATAMISALTGAKIRNDVGMTGEITIRGRVLPIGGLKEKVIAAKKAGIRKVLLPEGNSSTLDELEEEIKADMDFVLVSEMHEVLTQSVAEGESVWK